jgi:hypothetical protein
MDKQPRIAILGGGASLGMAAAALLAASYPVSILDNGDRRRFLDIADGWDHPMRLYEEPRSKSHEPKWAWKRDKPGKRPTPKQAARAAARSKGKAQRAARKRSR